MSKMFILLRTLCVALSTVLISGKSVKIFSHFWEGEREEGVLRETLRSFISLIWDFWRNVKFLDYGILIFLIIKLVRQPVNPTRSVLHSVINA